MHCIQCADSLLHFRTLWVLKKISVFVECTGCSTMLRKQYNCKYSVWSIVANKDHLQKGSPRSIEFHLSCPIQCFLIGWAVWSINGGSKLASFVKNLHIKPHHAYFALKLEPISTNLITLSINGGSKLASFVKNLHIKPHHAYFALKLEPISTNLLSRRTEGTCDW